MGEVLDCKLCFSTFLKGRILSTKQVKYPIFVGIK
ncbi:hypothetical protein CCACVL1_13529 [Corchorus capsularis]|uniref:Uncharacterized protein n=1 Tax=Corchorus capsularis TaxID=210143 RepID=A0A1R3IAL7_COCAP|nr:hypothetical protein CCACVL1_13529 [Corchorus capsularis]